MSSNGIPIIKLAFHHEWKVLTHALKSDPNLEMEDFQEAGEVATYLSSVKAAIVIVSMGSKPDFIQLASLQKIHKKVAPDTIVKIVVINFSGDKNYEKATAKLGIQDLLDPGISTKALRFKVDFWIKGLNAQAKKAEAALAYKTSAKTAEANKGKAEETGITWQAPIDCEDDVWLIRQPEDCKKVLGKWLVRVTGPSPYVAQWTEVNGRSNLWKFEFKNEEKENFVSGNGSWYFRGEQKPDFVWKENVWMITGSQFDLYYQDSKALTSWMSMQNRNLTICKNSEYAKTKENLILQSFDKEMIFKKDGTVETKTELEQDGVDKFKNLEGKGKTEKQTNGPLSGKTTTDDLTSGLLSMDLDPNDNKLNDGKMAGPASDKLKKGSELSLDNKSNEHQKHWKGHNETEQYDAKDPTAPAGDKLKKGSELSLDSSNEHKKHWKGHNETEQFEAEPEKERKASAATKYKNLTGKIEEAEEADDGDYDGKSSTDKLNKFYSNGEKNKSGKQDKEDAPDAEVSELDRVREQKKAKKEAIEAQEKETGKREESTRREKDSTKKESHSGLKKNKEAQGPIEEEEEEFEDSDKSAPAREKIKKEKSAKTRETGEEQVEELSIEEELAARELKKRDKSEKDTAKTRKEEKESEEKTNQKGYFADDMDGNLSGKSKTDKLKSHYKNRDRNEEEIEEEIEESDFSDEPEHKSRKNLNRKGPESRVRSGSEKPHLEHVEEEDDAFVDDLDAPADSLSDFREADARLKKGKRKHGDDSSVAGVASIEEARKVKELRNVLEDVKDPSLEEAVESAEIIAMILQNNKQITCKFDDFFDQSIIFTTDDSSINQNTEVELDLSFKYLKKETKLKLKGLVSEEMQADDTKYVTIQINEDAIKAFEAFLKLYQIRQKNIDFFIKRVRGL